jgi:hypothetical protein
VAVLGWRDVCVGGGGQREAEKRGGKVNVRERMKRACVSTTSGALLTLHRFAVVVVALVENGAINFVRRAKNFVVGLGAEPFKKRGKL